MEWIAVFVVVALFACLVALLKRVEKLEEGIQGKLDHAQVKSMIVGKADTTETTILSTFGNSYSYRADNPVVRENDIRELANALGYEHVEEPAVSGWRKVKKSKKVKP